MILTHFSEKPLRLLKNKDYTKDNLPGWKPGGLWLSDETSNCGWSDWCRTSGFNIEGLKNKTFFKAEIINWIVIKTDKQLDAFTKKYLMKDVPELGEFSCINWKKVKKKYGGIIITPYLPNSRHKHIWYYSWDCASACVWDLTTIKRIKNGKQRTIQQTTKTNLRTNRRKGSASDSLSSL